MKVGQLCCLWAAAPQKRAGTAQTAARWALIARDETAQAEFIAAQNAADLCSRDVSTAGANVASCGPARAVVFVWVSFDGTTFAPRALTCCGVAV